MQSLPDDTQFDIEALKRQVHESRHPLAKALYLVAGTICVGLAVLGVVLPVVPTTPFLLLAAACYARSSERFYLWLLTNRIFGAYIRDWREHRGIALRVKLWIIVVLITTIALSIYFVPLTPVKIGLAITALIITTYILRLPTKSQPARESD